MNPMPLSENQVYTENWFNSDVQFNQHYPLSIQLLAARHWTPLSVARKAANFLAAETNARILDIGSGIGKFCLAAAHYKPKAFIMVLNKGKTGRSCRISKRKTPS
jgi:tRNA G46 methylase TrmB